MRMPRVEHAAVGRVRRIYGFIRKMTHIIIAVSNWYQRGVAICGRFFDSSDYLHASASRFVYSTDW